MQTLDEFVSAVQLVTALHFPRSVREKKNNEGKVISRTPEPWTVIDAWEDEHSQNVALWVPQGLYSIVNLEKQVDAIYAAVGGIVKLIDRAGVVQVVKPLKDFPPEIPFKKELLTITEGRSVLLGFDRMGEPVIHNFRVPHMLIAGMSGYGKTDLIRWIIFQLIARFTPEQIEIYIIDLKGFSFIPFAGVPHIRGIARDLAGALGILSDSYNKMRERSDKVWEAKKRKEAAGFRWRIVLIDEGSELSPVLKDTREEKRLASACWRYAGAISSIGREAGVGLMFCTQYPTAEVIRGQIKANMDAVVCFKTENETHSEVTLGRPDAASLPQGVPGRAILKRNMVHMQVPFIGDDEVWETLTEPYKYEWSEKEETKNEPGAQGEDFNDVH